MAVTTNKLQDWKSNFRKRKQVQPHENENTMQNGSYLSGESAVIVSGPSNLEGSNVDLIPVGLTQQAQLTQNKDINQIFEIGGRVPFFIPGRTQIRASLSRVLFHGPSLMYALYRHREQGTTQGSVLIPEVEEFGEEGQPYSLPALPYGKGGLVQGEENSQDDRPSHFWINLASAIFNKPVGLGIVLYDMNGEPYGGAYLEDCYIQNHNFGISANQTVLAENISISATKLKPLNPQAIPGGSDK